MAAANKIVFIALTAIVAVGVAAFLYTHERVPDSRYTGFRGEARINRFLAAEMLLERNDIAAMSAESLDPLKWLPDHSDTLVTVFDATLAVPGQFEALQNWVEMGGHLVFLLPNGSADLVDSALAQLGVSLVPVLPPDDDSEAADEVEDVTDFEYILNLYLAYHRLAIDDDTSFDATLSDELGIVAARGMLGDGYVTFVANDNFFDNDYLQENDHGRLLLDLVAGSVAPGTVWFVFDAAFTPLWQVIWNAAPYAVLGTALLIAAAIWAVIPSFGPMLDPAPPSRRSIVEHIRAAGTFSWRRKGAHYLGNSSAKAVLHRAEARHPGIGRLSRTKQAQSIAQMTGLDPQLVMDAIADASATHARDFTQQMKTLQKIRKEL